MKQEGSLLIAPAALLPEGWAEDVLLEIAPDGSLAAVRAGAETGEAETSGAERAAGPVLPGMPNLHSHAFQRAMAGLGERAGPSDDSFWTWREVMYGFVARLTPEQLQAVAAQLYVEMLEAGYTAVGEFHYLHHDPDGRPYDDPAELSRRVMEAARQTGIGLSHLPVLYGYGGFGGAPAGEGQKRFVNAPGAFVDLVERLRRDAEGDPQVVVGIAPHSLRAVTNETLGRAVEALRRLDPLAPIHIHIAEQQKEVQDCIAWCGARPVEWLAANQALDATWCLIHATHVTDQETAAVARLGAVVGLCPTTEANLGDGLFPARDFVALEGRFGIGSDSHISVSPIEELRWLEYGQRLFHKQRNLIGGGSQGASIGSVLFRGALAGGAQALGRPVGALRPGCRADLIVLDGDASTLLGRTGDALLDALIFSGNVNPVRDVMVGGRWRVREGRHERREAILADYRAALAQLLA